MGKSALRLWKKSALTVPVDPSPDKNGIKQPPYMRSHTAVQTSGRLNKYKSFIAKKLGGHHFKDRMAVREALTKAAAEWRSTYGLSRVTKKAYRRMGLLGRAAASEVEGEEEEELFWE